jgi:hypothetical protein
MISHPDRPRPDASWPISLALLVGLACVSPTAFGQTPADATPSTPGDQDKALAETLSGPAGEAYASANTLLNKGDFAGARAKYRQAYELSKDARLLFDMAICERNLRSYARMQRLLLQYEQEAGAGISAQDKAQVDDALAAIQNMVGTVKLAVSEAGAMVALDGEPLGTTPLEQPFVTELGTHRIVVTKVGFDTIEKTIDIVRVSTVELSIALVRQAVQARLIVTSDSDAALSIDGQLVGKGRFDGRLAPGTHDLRVSARDRLPYAAPIALGDGETRTVQVTLEPEHHPTLWPWLIGGAAVAAGAAVGGYFLFKSPDAGSSVPAGKLGTAVFQ